VVQEALSLGALGYVVEACLGSDPLAAVQAVILGKRFVSTLANDILPSRSKRKACAARRQGRGLSVHSPEHLLREEPVRFPGS
jgi:DNA-binding NarL/FixJ family response regulator